MPKKKLSGPVRPNFADIMQAMPHRVVLADMARFFAQANMSEVNLYLTLAYEEIDRIWEKSDFRSDPLLTNTFKPVGENVARLERVG